MALIQEKDVPYELSQFAEGGVHPAKPVQDHDAALIAYLILSSFAAGFDFLI